MADSIYFVTGIDQTNGVIPIRVPPKIDTHNPDALFYVAIETTNPGTVQATARHSSGFSPTLRVSDLTPDEHFPDGSRYYFEIQISNIAAGSFEVTAFHFPPVGKAILFTQLFAVEEHADTLTMGLDPTPDVLVGRPGSVIETTVRLTGPVDVKKDNWVIDELLAHMDVDILSIPNETYARVGNNILARTDSQGIANVRIKIADQVLPQFGIFDVDLPYLGIQAPPDTTNTIQLYITDNSWHPRDELGMPEVKGYDQSAYHHLDEVIYLSYENFQHQLGESPREFIVVANDKKLVTSGWYYLYGQNTIPTRLRDYDITPDENGNIPPQYVRLYFGAPNEGLLGPWQPSEVLVFKVEGIISEKRSK